VAESALGLIETRGLVGVIEAADTAVKAADVQLLGVEQVGGGLVSVRFTGDVAAVKAAVQAASAAAGQVTEVVSAHVIARPHDSMGELVRQGPRGGAREAGPVASDSRGGRATTGPSSAGSGSTDPRLPDPSSPGASDSPDLATVDDLASLSVAHLRRLARRTPGLGLKGRQISRANKEQLIQALNQVLDQARDSRA